MKKKKTTTHKSLEDNLVKPSEESTYTDLPITSTSKRIFESDDRREFLQLFRLLLIRGNIIYLKSEVNMSYDALEKELRSLPENYLPAVMNFIVLLKNHDKLVSSNPSSKCSRRAGIGKDPDFYMASDFDETPDCFKEYV